MGAAILGLYLGNEGEKVKALLDGALLYSTPWSTARSNQYFKESYYGAYNKILGLSLTSLIQTT